MSSLISCPHCAHQIHESAPSCPQCGATRSAADTQALINYVTKKRLFMKKLIAVTFFGLFHLLSAHAASNVGQCVFPKVKVAKNGNLQFKKPISIYSAPDTNSTKSTLSALTGFSVAKEANGLVQLMEVAGADGSNARAGKPIGWAKLTDFDFQELRNCN